MPHILTHSIPRRKPQAEDLQITEMLALATQEGKEAAADLFSIRLEKLANHAANSGLSATEIVELIREEAAAIESKGGAAWN